MPSISKTEAARRQLNVAIRLFFAAEDPIIVHSLASSAANLYADLVEQDTAAESWRKRFGNNGELAQRKVKAVLNNAWNFFKHADRDATKFLDFDEQESELMLFYATLECGELESTSDEMQLFQLWFLRTSRFNLDLSEEIQTAALTIFPDLPSLTRTEQLKRGHERLTAVRHANGELRR